MGAAGGTLADQWKEFFYCEAMDKEVMVVKGTKRSSSRSSNKHGSDNIISSGSGIAVADGQCMMIVEQGKVVEVCADPGEYTYDASTEPSIFSGSLGDGIRKTFDTIGKRFAFGGDTGKDQRVYYFNTKELVDNKFGTANPIPFRVVDSRIGLDVDVAVRCHGVYSYRIADPLLFYTNVCGNVEREYTREELDGQLKAEFISALQPAFGRLSELEMRPNQIVTHNTELEMIKQAQRTAMMRDPAMAAATLTGAQADAMKAAASNSAGAMTGFMGMGMAANAGGMNAQHLFEMGQKQQAQQSVQQQAAQPVSPAGNGAGAAAAAGSWTCSCGAVSSGKFCPECGASRPVEDSWTCSCGTVNKGKFCMNCGAKKPEKKMQYRCSRCGWEPADPENPPKFCPECGDPFGPEDAV